MRFVVFGLAVFVVGSLFAAATLLGGLAFAGLIAVLLVIVALTCWAGGTGETSGKAFERWRGWS